MTSKQQRSRGGLLYKAQSIYGKHHFRIREAHVRDHLAPLLGKRRLGAVKLDLALRGLALSEEHKGKRPHTGLILPRYTYEHLHDLVRDPTIYGDDPDSTYGLRLKRKWVGEQLQVLEEMQLVERRGTSGRRQLIVLRDDGSGEPYDDPEGRGGDTYVTITGGIFASGEIRTWKTPELAFYICAMVGERYHRNRRREEGAKNIESPIGGGDWYRTLDWFSNARGFRPESHVATPFSVATLERGLRRLRKKGLVEVRPIKKDPITGTRFTAGTRNLYRNKFNTLAGAPAISEAELAQVLHALDDIEGTAPPPQRLSKTESQGRQGAA